MPILSKDDIQVLKWEKTKREIDKKFSKLQNNDEREHVWRKSYELHKKISVYIYDHSGNFRKDLEHLLIDSKLNIELLDELEVSV